MTRTDHKLITADELLEMADLGPCELVEGEIVMMTPAGFQHGVIASRVTSLLVSHSEPNGLGFVVTEQTGFVLSGDPDTVRAPDVGFVCAGRVAEPPSGFFPGAPDLAVEVVSPDDRPGEIQARARMWLEAGARLVWVFWPKTRTVTVYQPGCEPQILGERDTLDGQDVLPGLSCAIAGLFGNQTR